MTPLSPPDSATIDRIVDRLSSCQSILFVTGAGMSADSGLPTYRGIGGLYNRGETEEGRPIEEMLSGETFRQRPEWTWKYLRQVETACRGAAANRGHAILAEMERRFVRTWILTQNVDGLHRSAGSRNVIDIHGDLHEIRCTGCRYRATVADYTPFGDLPRCPACAGILRPDVVLFGEALRDDRMRELKHQLRTGFDMVFSIGTTSVFPYIAYPVELAVQRDKPSVEINPDTTRMSALVTYRLALGAAQALDAIWARFAGSQKS
jgi:NAD-dependent deacetylase